LTETSCETTESQSEEHGPESDDGQSLIVISRQDLDGDIVIVLNGVFFLGRGTILDPLLHVENIIRVCGRGDLNFGGILFIVIVLLIVVGIFTLERRLGVVQSRRLEIAGTHGQGRGRPGGSVRWVWGWSGRASE
jgi:hypothetical protein